jgi:Tfp pilus assembly PilM family ATPase
MMTFLRNLAGRRSPIGIDVGARAVKAVQLRAVAGHRWAVAAWACIPRALADNAVNGAPQAASVTAPLSAAEVRRLHDVLDRQGFRGRDVVLAVPSSRLMSASLDLPPRSSGAPVDSIARAEFARAHKLPLDPPNFEFEHWELPAPARAGRTAQALAVGCTHADADAVIQPFEDDGLDVLAFDAEAWALARACAPLAAPPGRITALLDLGWNGCRLVVVHHHTSATRGCSPTPPSATCTARSGSSSASTPS